jgi:hypothetical protein
MFSQSSMEFSPFGDAPDATDSLGIPGWAVQSRIPAISITGRSGCLQQIGSLLDAQIGEEASTQQRKWPHAGPFPDRGLRLNNRDGGA